MPYQLQHQFDQPFAAPAELADSYAQALSPPSEEKLDNRPYALATLAAWPELLGVEPVPALDPDLVPIQPVAESMTVGYLDLLG